MYRAWNQHLVCDQRQRLKSLFLLSTTPAALFHISPRVLYEGGVSFINDPPLDTPIDYLVAIVHRGIEVSPRAILFFLLLPPLC